MVLTAKGFALGLATYVAAELHAVKEGILLVLSVGCSHLVWKLNLC